MRALTEKRLDRSVFNVEWLDMCFTMVCNTPTKFKINHYPILLTFNLEEAKCIYQFKFFKMWYLHEDCLGLISNT